MSALMLDPVSAVQASPGLLQVDASLPAAPIDTTPVGGGFGDWMAMQATQLNQELLEAESGVRALAAGEAVSVHQVMLQMEQARLSFQLAVQVKAKVLEAYQEVMKMQV